MKTIIYNDDNLVLDDITKKSRKARVILLDQQGAIYLSKYAGIYLLPGGKIGINEDIKLGAAREILEETGIELDITDIEPFLCVKQYIKYYPDVDSESNTNKLLETYYFLVFTDDKLEKDKINLTDREIKNHFKLFHVPLTEVSHMLEENETKNPRNYYYKRELESVIQELLSNQIIENQ